MAGGRTSKARVLRLRRDAKLLAPTRVGHAHGPAAHDGTITTETPDEMWGMDATSCLTRREGTATVFVVVDHCASECIGIPAAQPGTRFEAVEPLRQGGPRDLRKLRGEHRRWPAGPARSRQSVRERLLPRRAEVPGHHVQSRLRAGAGRQWRRRAVHPDAQGTVAVGANVRDGREAPRGAARLLRTGTIARGSASATSIRRQRPSGRPPADGRRHEPVAP